MKIKPNQHIPHIIQFLITYWVQKYKPHNFTLLLPKVGGIWKIQLFGHVAWATWAQKFWYWFYIEAWAFFHLLSYIRWKFLRYWAFWGSFFNYDWSTNFERAFRPNKPSVNLTCEQHGRRRPPQLIWYHWKPILRVLQEENKFWMTNF